MESRTVRIAKKVVIAYTLNVETNKMLQDLLDKTEACDKNINYQMPRELDTLAKQLHDGAVAIKKSLDKDDFETCCEEVEKTKGASIEYFNKAQQWINKTYPPSEVNNAKKKYLFMFNFGKLLNLLKQQIA